MFPVPCHRQSWVLAALGHSQPCSLGSHPPVPSLHAGLVGCSHHNWGPLCEAEVLPLCELLPSFLISKPGQKQRRAGRERTVGGALPQGREAGGGGGEVFPSSTLFSVRALMWCV